MMLVLPSQFTIFYYTLRHQDTMQLLTLPFHGVLVPFKTAFKPLLSRVHIFLLTDKNERHVSLSTRN